MDLRPENIMLTPYGNLSHKEIDGRFMRAEELLSILARKEGGYFLSYSDIARFFKHDKQGFMTIPYSVFDKMWWSITFPMKPDDPRIPSLDSQIQEIAEKQHLRWEREPGINGRGEQVMSYGIFMEAPVATYEFEGI